MKNLVLNSQVQAIKIEHFIHFSLQNNLIIFVILTNLVKTWTSNTYKNVKIHFKYFYTTLRKTFVLLYKMFNSFEWP